MQNVAEYSHKFSCIRKVNSMKTESKFFTLWLSLLNRNYIMRKGRFMRRINTKVKSKYFRALKTYFIQKNAYREGMKNLLKTRANNLMRLAFNKGLKLEWHSKIIDKNMKIASECFERQLTLKRPFRQLKKRMMARKHHVTL